MISSDTHSQAHSPLAATVANSNPPRARQVNKRFQCLRCHKQFARLEHLQRHERTHTQERPFACDQCDSRFNRSDLLIRHERLSHNRDGGKSRSQEAATSSVRLTQVASSSHLQRANKRPRASSAGEYGSQQMPESQTPMSRTQMQAASTLPQSPRSSPNDQLPDLSAQDTIGENASCIHVSDAALQDTHPPSVSPHDQPGDTSAPTHGSNDYQSPLTALSLAAEQTAFRDSLDASSSANYAPLPSIINQSFVGTQSETLPQSMALVDPRLVSMPPDMNDSFDAFASYMDTRALPSYHFTSWVTTEQPVPFFSFEPSFAPLSELRDNMNSSCSAGMINGDGPQEESSSFSRFGSRLPSLQPEEHLPDVRDSGHLHQPPHPSHPEFDLFKTYPRKDFDVTPEDRESMIQMIAEFSTVPSGFRLPTRISLARYIRAYIDGFHEHLPFLHTPSLSFRSCSVELLLAMAAVGAQYCFEARRGVELFHVSRAIATERIRRRDVTVTSIQRDHESLYSACSVGSGSTQSSPATHERAGSTSGRFLNGPLGLPSEPEPSTAATSSNGDLMQSAQALLLLMAMATWAKHKEILREALAIQSVLASIVRDDGLRDPLLHVVPDTWEEWIRYESIKRTKYIVFCFFNLHCIVYDIPPLILNSELNLLLPCSAAEFKADTAEKWQDARARAGEPVKFQDALRSLFNRNEKTATPWHSSLGNYVLIHAIIQDIFFARQTARCRFNSAELTLEDVSPIEHALRSWQLGWERNPESSVNPNDPNGPMAFNSTALLRLAYIRLNMDTGPGRDLGTRDPLQIAHALRDTPAIKRSSKLIRALLHSAHALSIPVKIGIRLVAKTQSFIWSIQHSLCSLECALLLSKWLEAISVLGPDAEPPISEDEKRILSFVKTVLEETDYAVPPDKSRDLPEMAKYLNAGVLRTWATIFRGVQIWAIVDVIGTSLNIYADLLEAS